MSDPRMWRAWRTIEDQAIVCFNRGVESSILRMRAEILNAWCHVQIRLETGRMYDRREIDRRSVVNDSLKNLSECRCRIVKLRRRSARKFLFVRILLVPAGISMVVSRDIIWRTENWCELPLWCLCLVELHPPLFYILLLHISWSSASKWSYNSMFGHELAQITKICATMILSSSFNIDPKLKPTILAALFKMSHETLAMQLLIVVNYDRWKKKKRARSSLWSFI